jgi:hypothetical protein
VAVQLVVLSQKLAGGRIKAQAAFWLDGVDTNQPPLFGRDFDLPYVTSYQQRVEDAAGRWTTQSGKVVLPVTEVDGEFQPTPEDPADPFQFTTVTVNAAAYARQQALAWAEWRASQPEE